MAIEWLREGIRARFRSLGFAVPLVRALLCAASLGGCVVARYADLVMPAPRLDRPTNSALPTSDHPAVRAAMDTWREASLEERERFPSAYHVYVDAPAPGSFEGDYVVGLAFSGGGTRGTYFGSECVRLLGELGDILVDGPQATARIALLEEVDYVAGASTGSIPAALFALDRSGRCPDAFRRANWPGCFNRDLVGHSLRGMAMRPDRAIRDFSLGMNTRPALSGAIAAVFFEGSRYDLSSGLTFGDLPRAPIVLISSTVVSDPGAAFVQTRLPYRFTLDEYPEQAWGVGVQSFESFRTDPMSYPLGEACYNSLSYPGHASAGLMAVRDDKPWVLEGIGVETRERMLRARNQPGFDGTYELKDGGLVDNRAISPIDEVFHAVAARDSWAAKPLLVCLDAGYRELRAPDKGNSLLRTGWLGEIQASSRASWQTGQDAYERLFESRAEGDYALVRFRFAEWTRHMPEDDADATEASRRLVELCEDSDMVRTPARLLEILRGIGTGVDALSPKEMEGVEVAARFALWAEKGRLLQWASSLYDGAPARFSSENRMP